MLRAAGPIAPSPFLDVNLYGSIIVSWLIAFRFFQFLWHFFYSSFYLPSEIYKDRNISQSLWLSVCQSVPVLLVWALPDKFGRWMLAGVSGTRRGEIRNSCFPDSTILGGGGESERDGPEEFYLPTRQMIVLLIVPLGLMVWFSHRMRGVSGSNSGTPQFLHEEDPNIDTWSI